MAKKIVISSIKWDTDGMKVDLPRKVVIDNPSEDLLEDAEMYADAIADYLSDEYGFCVENFKVKVKEM